MIGKFFDDVFGSLPASLIVRVPLYFRLAVMITGSCHPSEPLVAISKVLTCSSCVAMMVTCWLCAVFRDRPSPPYAQWLCLVSDRAAVVKHSASSSSPFARLPKSKYNNNTGLSHRELRPTTALYKVDE